MTDQIKEDSTCPCCSDLLYKECCAKFINKEQLPDTPEKLMRSRYTAYTIADIDYVFDTMRDEALKDADRKASLQWSKTSKWLGLEILNSPEVKPDSTEGEVEFIASFHQNNKKHDLKEHSRFKKYDGRWYYIGNQEDFDYTTKNMEPIRVTKIGRNDPCECGSGKKYKKCCIA